MKKLWTLALRTALFAATLPVATQAADVHVGIHLGIPAPPAVVFEAPPRLVVVPGVPEVEYAPDVSVNFFSYGGHYYTYEGGHWFIASEERGPWTYVETRRVPRYVLHVPYRYYHVPPRVVGGGHWRHGDDSHHDWRHGWHHGWHGNGHHQHHGHH